MSEGAELVIDGRGFCRQGYQDGFFLGPSLFDHVTREMRIYREEIFGPVVSIVRTASLDEALDLVNAHNFGNGSVIFTKDGALASDFARRVETGMAGVNVLIPVPMAFNSFGGWKASLFGDHHMHGAERVRFYTRLKTVTTKWRREPDEETTSAFAMPTFG